MNERGFWVAWAAWIIDGDGCVFMSREIRVPLQTVGGN